MPQPPSSLAKAKTAAAKAKLPEPKFLKPTAKGPPSKKTAAPSEPARSHEKAAAPKGEPCVFRQGNLERGTQLLCTNSFATGDRMAECFGSTLRLRSPAHPHLGGGGAGQFSCSVSYFGFLLHGAGISANHLPLFGVCLSQYFCTT